MLTIYFTYINKCIIVLIDKKSQAKIKTKNWRDYFMDCSMVMELLEAFTILCFGLSWPISIYKSVVSRTAKGKSLFFEVFLLLGYAFGITRKIMQITALGCDGAIFYLSFFFYVLNFIEIGIDVALYFRNVKLDKMRALKIA